MKTAFLKTSKLLKENQDFLIVVAIFFLALFFRVWQIDQIPPGLSAKELSVVQDIKNLKANHFWLSGRFYQGLYVYGAYVIFQIMGFKIIFLRIFSALIGSLTVMFSYLFVRQWFSQKVATFSSFLFAISSFHVSLSRLIIPEIFLPFLLLLLFVVLTNAYRSKKIWLFGLAGFLVGLGLYSSPAFMIVPFMFMTSGLYFYQKDKRFVNAYKHELIVALAGFLASAITFIVSFLYHPMSYLTHFGFRRSFLQVILNIGEIARMLFGGTNPDFFINVGIEPLFDPLVYITGVAGFVLASFYVRRRKYFFLLCWWLIFFLYAALKRGTYISDLIGFLPVVFTFSALSLDLLIDKWITTFPYNKKAQMLFIFILSVFFALSALYNYDKYFVAYKNSTHVKNEFAKSLP